jgi:tetratricopeptide (TPR) repeat protein
MKRIFLPFLFLLFSITLCYSQYIDETNERQIDSFESLLSSQTDSEKLFTHLKLINLHLLSSSETAKKYIDSLNENAIKLKNEEYIGHSIRGLGQYYYQISKFDDAVETYKKAITKFDSLHNKEELSKIYNLLAITQSVKGDLDSAAESSLKSITIAEDIGITGRKLAAPYLSLGTLFARLRNYEKAIEYFNKAEKIAEEIDWEPGKARIKVNLGNVYKLQYKFNEALLNYNEAEAFFRKVNDFKNLGTTLNNIGAVYKKLNDYTKSRQYYNKALEFENKLQPQLVGLLNRNIGELYSLEGKYSEALKYYKISKSYSEMTGNNDRLLDDFDYIGEAYANLGQYKKAYENQLVFNRMYDSIYNIKRVTAIEELETKYETEKKQTAIILQEEEIKTLNAQAENDRLTKTLYGIGMFSFLTISGLLYFGFKQRIKKNKIAREKQEEIYKQEIEFKQKELASQTLHLVQKSTFIQELKENLEKIKKSPELFKVEFRRLVMLLKKESAEDKDWEVFKSYFSQVHNNFDHKIKAIAEDITEKEIRLASFLRMNLSTKEIASMLNVLPDSVLKSKYRLKKKLQLEKEDDLTQFLNTL